MERQRKKMTEEAALVRLSGLCMSAEYCLADMRRKMQVWDLPDGAEERILQRLQQEKFVDENRYAHAFVRDKSRQNRWGRIRIEFELHKRGISNDDIQDALTEIEEEEDDATLIALLRQKAKTTKARNEYELLVKLMRFAAQRGFTQDQVQRCLRQAIQES